MSDLPIARPAVTPQPFQPSFEQVPDDEAQTSKELMETLHAIMEKTFKDNGHAYRGVHAKAHGLLRGQVTVFDDLPPVLAQGAFAKPGILPVYLRFSTNPGDILNDKVSTPRGLAIKIVGVEGSRLPGSEGATTQDFVMVNAKAFTSATPKAFLKTLKLLAKTTDRAPRTKQVISTMLRGAEAALEAVGGESSTLKNLGGHPQTHILGESFTTVVPVLYGPYYAKLAMIPVSPSLTALTDRHVDLQDDPDGLRAAVAEYFARQGGTWELRVQLATDIEKMPIEDASTPWPEDLSPYVTVARIDVEVQASWDQEKAREIDDAMAFSPWHGLAAHRPLGGIMRVRKPTYEMSVGYRANHNGCPIHEPGQ
ncbi:catalase family protein [Pseudomonas capeferrum]|uniref:catalase family protein n=1 Tax=Pseudomonas capeferrum TaxID=1495066 RepID=UPI0015E3CD08|nr:catalase family protein [Pseudomonas capeferrum]MBA1200595.1 catalase family protein [Pseudomonas capeferrum]